MSSPRPTKSPHLRQMRLRARFHFGGARAFARGGRPPTIKNGLLRRPTLVRQGADYLVIGRPITQIGRPRRRRDTHRGRNDRHGRLMPWQRPFKTKICGVTNRTDLDALSAYSEAWRVGLVFFPPSPRNLSPEEALTIAGRLPIRIQRVGVFVDPSNDLIDAVDGSDSAQCDSASRQRNAGTRELKSGNVRGFRLSRPSAWSAKMISPCRRGL